MKKILVWLIPAIFTIAVNAQNFSTPFEKSNGTASATYFEAIAFFEQMAKASAKVNMKKEGITDAGYPLHLVTISNDGNHNPQQWKALNRIVILVNNSIHPGEPDGTDASMLLVRDIVNGKRKLPNNVCLAIIPVYNIGGALNRGNYSRVNQNGPLAYGFRGNAQNLDLNRDFTKADSRNSQCFSRIFHALDPDILIDNHVSDGADFQHTMTLLTTQYDKLGGTLGNWLRQTFEPGIYAGMKTRGWDVFPYVNFNAYDLNRGMTQFYDPPRYSSGYAALFGTIGFVPETHMLKPYKDRVQSTYDLMVSIAEQASLHKDSIKMHRLNMKRDVAAQQSFALEWSADTSRHSMLTFKGYERDTTNSVVTGLPRMYYRRDKPFDSNIRFFNFFNPAQFVHKPKAYVIPQGWYRVVDLLKLNKVNMRQVQRDTLLELEVYRIENYTAAARPYEGHFRHSKVQVKAGSETIKLLKGDYLVYTGQPTDRFMVEMLEPTGADSYFAWNYFDAILQQKEGYSNYRWEEVAAAWLAENPALKAKLEEKKKNDPAFAKNSNQILNWVYINSPYHEPSFMRYPVYRLL